MADELDPRLEARLRTVLRAEADALPFAIRGGELERRAAERLRARSRRLMLLASAAVVVIAVGGVALLSFMSPRSDVAQPPSPLPDALPSFERLIDAWGRGSRQVIRAELGASPAGTQTTVGDIRGFPDLAIAFACTGQSIELRVLGDAALDPVTYPCTGGIQLENLSDLRIANAAQAPLQVTAPAGVAWRLVVLADGGVAPSPAPSTSPSPAADCVPVSADGAFPAFGIVDSIELKTFLNTGTVTYRRIGTAKPEGDAGAWYVDPEPWRSVELAGPPLVLDAGTSCVQTWDIRIARSADVEAAIAAGTTPAAEPQVVDAPEIGHDISALSLPTGDLTIRVEVTWWTDGGPAATEVRAFRVFVAAPRPTPPAGADPVNP